jgi:hypothetical protein
MEQTPGDPANADQSHGEQEQGLEISDLQPGHMQPGHRDYRRAGFGARLSERTAGQVLLMVSVVLLLAVLVNVVPHMVARLTGAGATPTPAETSVISNVGISISSSTLPPATPQTTPTPLPGESAGIPPLGAPPAACDSSTPALTQQGPPTLGLDVGGQGVWIDGFSGSYPTLNLKADETGASGPFGWPLHYTQYGWPAPVALMIGVGVVGPITLTGWDVSNQHPLWFGFTGIASGPPPPASTSFTIYPEDPSVPAGGGDNSADFWYGYIFLPGAGCFALSVSEPNQGWKVLVSAGA